MTHQKKNLLYKGKAKSLYETDDPNYLITEFRDDTTAFDGVRCEQLKEKGIVNNCISAYIMQLLEKEGVPTHFVKQLSSTETVVKPLKMFPIESVIRNVAAGSLSRRLGIEQGKPLSPPITEYFYKDDSLHDPMIQASYAITFGWATEKQLDQIHALTLTINTVLSTLFKKAGLILVDAKFEFGVDINGNVTLGDEISPDSCRIWDFETKTSFDKDRFRKDLGDVVAYYRQFAKRLGIPINI